MNLNEQNKILEEIKKRPDVKKYKIIYLISLILMWIVLILMFIIENIIADAIFITVFIGLTVLAVVMNKKQKNLINNLISILSTEQAMKELITETAPHNEPVTEENNEISEESVREERENLANRLISISNKRNVLNICSVLVFLLGIVFLLFLPICEVLGENYSVFNLLIDRISNFEIDMLKGFVEAEQFNKTSVIIFLITLYIGLIFVVSFVVAYGKMIYSGSKKIYACVVEPENNEITINPYVCSTKVDKIGVVIFFVAIIVFNALFLIFPITFISSLDVKDSLASLLVSVNYTSIILYALTVLATIALQIYMIKTWFMINEDDRVSISGYLNAKVLKKHY